jgi:hypothetical protein
MYSLTSGANLPSMSTGLVTFFTSLKPYIPASITIGIPASGQIYDDATGLLGGVWGSTVQPGIAGTGAGAFGSASGGSIKWATGAVVRRHTLVGRTFLVPLVASAFNANGVLAPAAVTAIGNAAQAFANVGALRIWSRPRAAFPVGASAVAVVGTCTNVDAILRSRRQ